MRDVGFRVTSALVCAARMLAETCGAVCRYLRDWGVGMGCGMEFPGKIGERENCAGLIDTLVFSGASMLSR